MIQRSFIPEPGESGALTDRLEQGLLPLINVVFLLLMFFLIAGIILRDEMPPLPDSADTGENERPELDLVAESGGELRFHGQPVPRGQLAARLPDYDPEQRLRVGADQELSMAELESLFQQLAQAGHPQVVLLTEKTE